MVNIQKGSGGHARGHKYLIGLFLVVVSLVCIQLWAYAQTWPDQVGSYGTPGKEKVSFFGDKNRSSVLSRQILQAVTLCTTNSHESEEEEFEAAKMKTAKCLMKLPPNYPSLQISQEFLPPPSFSPEVSSSARAPKGSDKLRIEALENQIEALSVKLRKSTVFLELKDTRESGLSDGDNNWFMSSLHRLQDPNGYAEEFEFPSESSHGRLLCLMGNHSSNGAKNKYGFAWEGYLPPGSTLLPGLTLVADNYWDYQNIWHGMSALVNFVSWRTRQACVVPERVVLYHWGELVSSMGPWIDNVLHASFGRKLEVETLDNRGSGGPVCLQRAIVNRRGLGGMSLVHMNSMFDTIRCKARKFCQVELKSKSHGSVSLPLHLTLLVRSGARAFEDLPAVTRVLEKVCENVGDCYLEVAHVSNLSFCEQVAVMSRTDVLVTTHGAQMTNSMFMFPGSSVMELIPKGWLEFAGVGQYIYSWLADWSNLHYEGVWRDPDGPGCPYPIVGDDTLKCFLFHKDRTVSHNQTHLAEWTTQVIGNFRRRQEEAEATAKTEHPSDGTSDSLMNNNCTCDIVDDYIKSSSRQGEFI